MTGTESNAGFEGAVLQALLESHGYTICARCLCCTSSVAGEFFATECLGGCDANGNHAQRGQGGAA